MDIRQKSTHTDARTLVSLQAFSSVLCLLVWREASIVAAASFFLGVGVCFVPTWRFYRRFFSWFGAPYAKAMMATLYGHVFFKFIWLSITLGFFLRWQHAEPLWFFAGMLCAQCVVWLLPIKWMVKR